MLRRPVPSWHTWRDTRERPCAMRKLPRISRCGEQRSDTKTTGRVKWVLVRADPRSYSSLRMEYSSSLR